MLFTVLIGVCPAVAQGVRVVQAQPSVPVRPLMTDIRRMANELHAAGSIATHTALYEIAYPDGPGEYTRMSGYGLLLVTTLSHESEEMQIARVFAQHDTLAVEMELVAALSSRTSLQDSTVRNVLGRYRTDAVFLFPILLRFIECGLFVEFGTGPSTFHLADFPGVLDVDARIQPRRPPTGRPDPVALDEMLWREFGDFRGRHQKQATVSHQLEVLEPAAVPSD